MNAKKRLLIPFLTSGGLWSFFRLGEGRGGEEGRSRGAPDHLKKKKKVNSDRKIVKISGIIEKRWLSGKLIQQIHMGLRNSLFCTCAITTRYITIAATCIEERAS